jgi:hypothetical protein
MKNNPRREITPEEEEELLRQDEERLKTLSGEKAERLKERIEIRKNAIARMRAETVRIFQHIPTREK